jgi:hypothetical protein
MFNHQYDSLTGAVAFQYAPDDTLVVSTDSNAVVSLSEAKNVLRVNQDEDDSYITGLIEATTEQIERYIRRDVVGKTRKSHWTRPAYLISLPYGPHGNVVSVQSICDNVTTNVTDYRVIGLEYKRIVLNEAVCQVEVTYESGFTVAPATVKNAVLQEVSFQYKNRQDPDAPRMVSVDGLSLESRQLLYTFLPRL